MMTFLKSTALLLFVGSLDYCLANAATHQQATPPHSEFFLARATQVVAVPAPEGDGTTVVTPNDNDTEVLLTKSQCVRRPGRPPC